MFQQRQKSTPSWPITLSAALCVGLCLLISQRLQLSRATPAIASVNRRIVIFECPGGTDKLVDGHRGDTAPLLAAFHDAGFEAESIFYTDSNASKLLKELASSQHVQKPVAFISRVDPGVYEHCTMRRYYEFLRRLAEAGIAAFNHPDDMEALGQKRSLLRLQGMSFFANDTYLYPTEMGLGHFSEGFAHSLGRAGSRVIKQNRGSKGEGILWVSLLGSERPQSSISNSTALQIMEASNNQVMIMSLGDFLDYVALQYLAKAGDAIVDMPFLPRIAEGEIRLILSGRRVVYVVEKMPKGAANHTSKSDQDTPDKNKMETFSANLGSGAKHVWHLPEEFPQVVQPFSTELEELLARMGLRNPPPLWTADFIRAGPKDETRFVLSEINANCVGFKSFPHLAHDFVSSVATTLNIHADL